MLKKQPAQVAAEDEREQYGEAVEDAEAGAEKLIDAPVRPGIDSQGQFLEPLYEDEEETITVLLNDELSKPTAKATSANYGRLAGRSRSSSPHKRAGSVQPHAEEQMITRAGCASLQISQPVAERSQQGSRAV